jgi:hypothetical protein
MPIAAGIVTLIIIACIVHIHQTGRPRWWMLVVLIAPVLGSVAYFMFEVFPNSRQGVRTAKNINRTIDTIGKSLNPDRDLRELAANAEECGSVDNRVALARECMSRGLGDEAVKLMQSCLSGPYANDPALLLDLAQAQNTAKRTDDALQTLERLRVDHAAYQQADCSLLKAQVLRDAGRSTDAIAAYAEASEKAIGEQARFEYAACLHANGQSERARPLLDKIIANAERNNEAYRDFNRDWIKQARSMLATLNKT